MDSSFAPPGIDCTDLASCYEKGGWFWLAAFASAMLVRWYQSAQGESFAAHISRKAVWSNMPLALRLGVVVVVSCIGAMLAGMQQGKSWWVAALSGIPAAVVAAGMDRNVDAVKRVVTSDESRSIRVSGPEMTKRL